MEIRCVVQNIETKKYISWINDKGTITYCVKPLTANYFVSPMYAMEWMNEKNLSTEKFKVVIFKVS